MKIEEVFHELSGGTKIPSTSEIVTMLTTRDIPFPDIEAIEAQWNPSGHDIFDKTIRKDKTVKKEVEGRKVEDIEPVARIALALQKLIVKRAASFLFGLGEKVGTKKSLTENESFVLGAVKKILRDNKTKSHNKEFARDLFKCTEVAELWVPVHSDKSDRYGFESEFRIRKQILSFSKGHKLYPKFDDTGDLIAFSFESTIKKEGKEVRTLTTYTDSEKVKWELVDGYWNETERKVNPIGKIPIVYARQEQTEWADVQNVIDRLEKLLSNYSDTIDYHASPTIFVQGEIKGFSKKGESGKIIEGENNAKAEYLSWDQAPDAVKLEIENDLRMIFSLTQTPDISFESVKGIGTISGVALKLLFLDAHLKVEDKKDIFDDFLTRRYNILKAYIGEMSNQLKSSSRSLALNPVITPYMIDDPKSKIETLSSAIGGGQLISRRTAVTRLGFTKDINGELAEIKKDESGNSLLS